MHKGLIPKSVMLQNEKRAFVIKARFFMPLERVFVLKDKRICKVCGNL